MGSKAKDATADKKPARANGSAVPDAKARDQIKAVRARLHEGFGKVVLALMTAPRYRHMALADLQLLVLDPLIRDRIAIATAVGTAGEPADAPAGIAIWASVSEEVDAKIREQIKAGVFPIRLKPDEWTSGSIHWLLDVVAPNQRMATAVIANFRQVVKEGDLRIHPLVKRLVDPKLLKAAVPLDAKAEGGDAPQDDAGTPSI